MKIKLYTTNSANNVINKTLENEIEYDIKFKDNTDIKNPMVILRSNDIILHNYAYIEKFNRYYFIERIELYPNSIYNIYLRVDVLETYKDEILKCEGYINQQTQKVNSYYDSDYKTEIRKEVDIYKSDVTLDDVSNILLTTIGG